MRNDIHSPSNLKPEDYDFRGFYFPGGSIGEEAAEVLQMRCEDLEDAAGLTTEADCFDEIPQPLFDGNFKNKRTCDHCGAAHTYSAVFLHKPTGEHVLTGLDCATAIASMDNLQATKRRLSKANKAEQTRVFNLTRYAEWCKANPQDADLLEFFAKKDSFIKDLRSKLITWGNLSEAQLACLYKNASQYHPELPDAVETGFTPIPKTNGRYELVGKILGIKEEPGFGYSDIPTIKILVKAGENKVWMTCPSALRAERGLFFKCKVALTQSDKDENFFFGKRPTKPEEIAC